MTPHQFQTLFVTSLLRNVVQFKPEACLEIQSVPRAGVTSPHVTRLTAPNVPGKGKTYDLLITQGDDYSLCVESTAGAEKQLAKHTVSKGKSENFHMLSRRLALQAFDHLYSAL